MKPPMLAATDVPSQSDLEQALVGGPLLLTPKFDGIRCLNSAQGGMSRTLKRLPNLHIQEMLDVLLEDAQVDGEIVCYHQGKMLDFNSTQSAVMSKLGMPLFKYHIFDAWGIYGDYESRIQWLNKYFRGIDGVEVVYPEYASTVQAVYQINQKHLMAGYEGSIARPANSPYKHGRSTLKQGWMLKLKPFEDREAYCHTWVPLERNQNPPKINALGLQERSSHGSGKVTEHAVMGALLCTDERWGQIRIGTGFTDLQRCNPEQFLQQQITYTYQPNHTKDKPHCPRFKAIRYDL